MRGKIFWTTLISLCCVALLVAALIAGAIYASSVRRTEESNREDAGAMAEWVGAGGDIALYAGAAKKSGVRVTWIDKDGTVLFDNNADAATMENHATREEFVEAMQSGTGEAMRSSATLGEQYMYYAMRLSDGTVLRVARSQRTMLGLLEDMRGALALVVALALVLSGAVSSSLSRGIVRPLLNVDLDHPDANDVYPELAPMLRRIGTQQEKLNQQLSEARTRSEQLAQITGNMREGLVILDERGVALSVNESARMLMRIDFPDCAGRHLFELNRREAVRTLFEDVRQRGAQTATDEMGDRTIEMRMSPVVDGGKPSGYVLLIVDATEKADAERMRREFSANVSHELKTPLTSISGYAEIMQNGMVAPEDVQKFAGRIYHEAQRMIALVEDIMRLSKLDEGDMHLPIEEIDARDLAEEIASSLSAQARAKNVTMTVAGEPFKIQAARQVAWEVLYNLVDNAVKYNVDGGSVRVTVENRSVCVEDTGIGIPPEHREKVFERFYRVDKSHSRSTGGTGLGLSIVKHGAKLMGASLRMESQEGKGTKITVTFP